MQIKKNALLIGMKEYHFIKSPSLNNLPESHNDVDRLYELCEKDLEFQKKKIKKIVDKNLYISELYKNTFLKELNILRVESQ